ncbi:MAG TPA: MFS transporter [Rhizomicrobium sp.]|jgi:MFS family permease
MSGKGLPARRIAAVVIGNGLEFYDFVTFAFFATQIGDSFFPQKTPQDRLLLSLAAFGVGFLARPVGSYFIGRMGDRRGRKPALLLSFALMGIGLLGLALTPSYRAIGIAAPIAAVAFRLLQGFALGGQVGPATAYLIEAAPPGKRGFYASLSYFAQDFSAMMAGVVGTILSSLMSHAALSDYGWRIAFLIGAVIVPFGLIARRELDETFHGESEAPKPPPLRPYLRVALLGMAMLLCGTVVNYVLNYSTTFAINSLHFGDTVSFGATIVVGAVTAAFDLVSGWLSDRYGRKPLMLIPYALFFIVALPIFYAMVHVHSVAVLYGGLAVLCTLQGLGGAPVVTWITESLPPAIRAGAVSVIYAVSISIFGGSTQFAVTRLIDLTGSNLVPAFYMMGGMLLGLTAMALAKETKP